MESNDHTGTFALDQNWEFARCAPGSCELGDLEQLTWLPARVPGTVAENLYSSGLWDHTSQIDLDSDEYWFRCDVTFDEADEALRFEGLATLADAWLNDQHILSSDNMFRSYEIDLPKLTGRQDYKLILRFASLATALEARKPRAKWRTQLVSHKNLRFFRTSLLGRTPGICPNVAPIGPWRYIRVVRNSAPLLSSTSVAPRIADGTGKVEFSFSLLNCWTSAVTAFVRINDELTELSVRTSDRELNLSGTASVHNLKLWWPHTDGTPYLYSLSLIIRSDGITHQFRLPSIGFRSIALAGDLSDFGLVVNGRPIQCRGACWIPPDLISLRESRNLTEETLTLARDAGMNMLRIPGTTIYGTDDLFELCDQLGILVWQDFMFASMDYPADDNRITESIVEEAEELFDRIGHRPCLAITCGGSEIQQQVTMLGLELNRAKNRWFDKLLPDISKARRPDIVHCPHSPVGGAMPFYGNEGVSHYFAVGGYRHPTQAAHLEPPKFASECLGFAIPPSTDMIEQEFRTGEGEIDWTKYESRIPRDNGSDWNFGAVTDYYLKEIFAVDGTLLRSQDEELYLRAAAIATGEVMRRTLEGWRVNKFTNGALILSLRDPWPSPGWGIIDSYGNPKAPYYFLSRTWQPTTLVLMDRATNGLWILLVNDAPSILEGELSIRLHREDGQVVHECTVNVVCEPRDRIEWNLDLMIGGFIDSSYAYKFGPRPFDLVHAVLHDSSTGAEFELLQRPGLRELPRATESDQDLSYEVINVSNTEFTLALSTSRWIDFTCIDCPGLKPEDNYFGLIPGKRKLLKISGERKGTELGLLGALGMTGTLPLRLSRSV